MAPLSPVARSERITSALPEGGLFSEKTWRVSPEAFPLDRSTVRYLEQLGPLLARFQQAGETIYRRSRKGSLPGWIAESLDAGKPPALLEQGLAASPNDLPRVIRPDLILTEQGLIATELDSVPGGIGLTAWLGEKYHQLDPSTPLVGGPQGMIDGFRSLFSEKGADIVISAESGDYRPEMDWLAAQLRAGRQLAGDGDWQVKSAETYQPDGRDLYRFFELFDLPALPAAAKIAELAAAGTISLSSPFKPWHEEKQWSALFWSHPLRETWRRELRDANFQRLRQVFPMSWIIDPAPVPPHAVLPGLDIQHFSELRNFSQSERELVLKLSGFNEKAWGSRSVTIGQDSSQTEWAAAVDEALAAHGTSPYVLQRFHGGKLVRHPWWNPTTGEIEIMEGRVRLCPYYFIGAADQKITLGGVLATICPADKKILHGMSDAILAPCRIEE